MTTDELRAKFEMWATIERGSNLQRDPLHPDEYLYRSTDTAWKSWQAAYASRDAEVEANERTIPDGWELFCCQCFASESSGSWDHVVVGSFCTNCCGNGTAFPLPKVAIESIRNQASWVGKRYYPHKEDTDLRAEVEALKRDAERYRWLSRKHANPVEKDWYVYGATGPFLSDSIDAAMREESK